MSGHAVRRLDRGALLGLAHPLRVQLYDALSSQGPATASELARRLGESSGSTSYHLRQLERHGFVETDPDRGNRRERWWRATREFIQTRSRDYADDPATAQAHRLLSDEWVRTRRARQDHWRATRRQWPEAWQAAAGDSISHLWLTTEEADELQQQLVATVTAWVERAADREGEAAYQPVEVQLSAFPVGDPPAT
ncbi:ArsR/SmtB family transcription factor [Nocardioides marmoraquaticus]